MIFRQYLHNEPVAASYIFGCVSKSTGIVVDPLLSDVDLYIRESERLGMRIKYVIDTHLHADHLSGARAISELSGAKYVLHRSADTNYEFTSVDDGDELVAGNTIIKVLHTPGHTPEHISLLVTDKSRGDDPWFLLSGHSLMIGDVGRTELASDIRLGAADLYESLFNKLLMLDDHLEIYPGAFSGSVCGRGLSGKPSSNLGFEKRFNKALQFKDKQNFVSFMTENVPPQPEEFKQIRLTNQGYYD
ncbi:MAG: MBL fold metallo-hydrolase [Paenibacillaceae bacterium]